MNFVEFIGVRLPTDHVQCFRRNLRRKRPGGLRAATPELNQHGQGDRRFPRPIRLAVRRS